MGADCCSTNPVFEGLSADYKRRLWAVIAINAAMFVVEIGAGALAARRRCRPTRSISSATR